MRASFHGNLSAHRYLIAHLDLFMNSDCVSINQLHVGQALISCADTAQLISAFDLHMPKAGFLMSRLV